MWHCSIHDIKVVRTASGVFTMVTVPTRDMIVGGVILRSWCDSPIACRFLQVSIYPLNCC